MRKLLLIFCMLFGVFVTKIAFEESKNKLLVYWENDGYCSHAFDCGDNHKAAWIDVYGISKGKLQKIETINIEYIPKRGGYFVYPQ